MTKDRRATIADVARAAGVSEGTVSHFLSGRTKVSERLRSRIEHAITDLNYVPNIHAQGLRNTSSRLVGFCIPHTVTSYSAALVESFDEIVSAAGYGILHVSSRTQPYTELTRVRELLRYRIDGLILFPSSAPGEALEFLATQNVPTVLIDRSNDDDRFDQVVLKNRESMAKVTRELLDLGHRNFLLICKSRQNLATRHRVEGFRLAEAEKGIPAHIWYIEYNEDETAVFDKLKAQLRGRDAPTVVISSSSRPAAMAMAVISEMGLKCPEDISLITFDDPDWSMIVSPPLSVIRQPARQIADTAWSLLLQRMEAPERPVERISLDADVVFRASIGPAKGEQARGRGGRAVSRRSTA